MFNPSPYVPSIHFSDPSHSPYFGHTPTMNFSSEMQRPAAEPAESRPRRTKEGAHGDLASDDNDNYPDDRGVRVRRDYDYGEEDRHLRRDLPEAVFFRREQDDMEIAHMERRVVEANRALDAAVRDLKETKMRIRDRRREERQRLNERSASESVRPLYEREPNRDFLSAAGNTSRPSTPQPSSSNLSTRSRSPSPYRFTSRTEPDVPRLPSQSVHEPRSRSRTPNTIVYERDANEAASASQEQVYESFSKIHDLCKEFQTLKQNFVYPYVIDFQKPGSQAGEIIAVRICNPPAEDELMSDGAVGSEDLGAEGKLAYTRTNEALHTYSYAMEKLLGKLDSVDSWNETSVRAKRRGIIGEIEQEASKLERYRQKVWRDYCARYS